MLPELIAAFLGYSLITFCVAFLREVIAEYIINP